MSTLRLLATAPRGIGDLLAAELAALGAGEVRERSGMVFFSGTLESAYRACLESRLANRVLLEIARFEAADTAAFYRSARSIDWQALLKPNATLACEFSGRHPTIAHSHFGALKLKDAIVDALREATGMRPDVVLDRPGVRVHAHAHGAAITLSIDLSGESLHRRGYRGAAGEAPLKENVAAGVLERSGWPRLAASGAQFLDPLCGSGTLAIEAALIAAHCAPGLHRQYFGFFGWRGHDEALWRSVREAAEARCLAGRAPTVIIRGQDRDPAAVRVARANAERAGVGQWVRFEVCPLAEAAPAEGSDSRRGLICTNPPYGVRLGDLEAARAVHRELGAVLRERFPGWQAAVLTGAPQLGMELGIRAARTHALWNGAIECRLLRMTVEPGSLRQPGTLARPESSLRETPGARMFANRLEKNMRRLRGWAKREGVSCYRLYDADMPEYAFAIDLYRTVQPQEEDWLYVQEYAAPADIEHEAVRRRRAEALASLPEASGVPRERIKVRLRRRTRRGEQYEKHGGHAEFHVVGEGGLRFLVNFGDYLDTGLFLDHRLTRERLRRSACGARFLNLFAYTGTATVYAAAGAAAETTSVDLSRTYLDWAQRNLELNFPAGGPHELIQADCLAWLRDGSRGRGRYDLIFLDPPTFSNSKRMEGVLDVQRDHASLIEACMQLLSPSGLLVFSTNAQRFRMDASVQQRYAVHDVSAATLPRDFERNPRIHRCFELRLP
jgi:23S rRNA (guanine2445-N2)-methyltransferase / 23S rRNA (guanine2069-N7)-methyltransferase